MLSPNVPLRRLTADDALHRKSPTSPSSSPFHTKSTRLHDPATEAVYSFRLLEALRQGDHKALRPFLTKAAQTPKGHAVQELTSPLHIAMRCAELSTVQLCLEYKDLDINAVEALHGNTPLHLAASLGRPDIVQLLLAQPAIDDTKRNKEGKEPMDVVKTPEVAQLIQGKCVTY